LNLLIKKRKNNMKVFITGADGFVGSNLIRELLGRNHQVVAFVKEGDDPKTIKDLDIEIKYGDLLNADSLSTAMKGCDAVVHTAALTFIWPYRSDIQKRVNIDGTKNVVAACKANNVKRYIHIGTANSFGYGSKENPGNETLPYACGRYGMDYMDTKYDAQLFVLNEAKAHNFPAIVITPTFMFGPYPARLGSAKMVVSVYQGKVNGYTKGGRNYIAVKDVCVAIANGLTQGRVGECYIVGNQNLNYKEIFSLIAGVVGVKPPKFAVPNFVVLSLGKVLTALAKTFNFEPFLSSAMAQMAVDEHYYSPKKAIKELGLPQTSLDVAVKESFDWLKENKYI
jgi:dihydroflavonol-4-reductase